MDVSEKLDKIESAYREEGESLADYCKRVLKTTPQTVHNWRTNKAIAATNQSRIEQLYQAAIAKLKDAGRTDDDHRRRAMAAVNLLEGRALKVLADLGVTLSAAQEFGDGLRQQAASAAVASAEAALRSLQMSQQTPVPAG